MEVMPVQEAMDSGNEERERLGTTLGLVLRSSRSQCSYQPDPVWGQGIGCSCKPVWNAGWALPQTPPFSRAGPKSWPFRCWLAALVVPLGP